MPIDLDYDRHHIWHPYTSMIDALPVYPAERTEGVHIILEDGTPLVDGMASWWSAIHGYNHPVITEAVGRQLDTMPHVMFGGLTHAPAVELCKNLIDITPPALDKVFLTDSGSVAVEVALKMAIQYWRGRGLPDKNKMITIKHGYHGDTFGAMSVCDPVNSMHSLYAGLLPRHYFVDSPRSKPGQSFDPADLDPVAKCMAENAPNIAAFILEPVVQGAGGMRFYHPQYVEQARNLCGRFDVLLIADEIATGFGRTGKMFAFNHVNVTPDILCLGKALTGGFMSLAATLCTTEVAMGISEGDAGVIMHGPTFMGNALACAAANASLTLLAENHWERQVAGIEDQLRASLDRCRGFSGVADVRVLGAIGVVEANEPVNVAEIQKALIRKGVWLRPFGKLIYTMPPYVIHPDQLQQVIDAMVSVASDL